MTEPQNILDPTVVSDDPLVPSQPRGVKTIEIDDELMDDIRELVRSQAGTILLNIVTDLHAADIAEIINRLDPEDQEFVFNLLNPAVGGAVLLDLNAEVRGPLMAAFSPERISGYVDHIPSDDAADIVAELSPGVADTVLRAMPEEDSSDVKELMQYRPDSAGGIMGTELIVVKMNDTVNQAIREVRAADEIGVGILHPAAEQRTQDLRDEQRLAAVGRAAEEDGLTHQRRVIPQSDMGAADPGKQ